MSAETPQSMQLKRTKARKVVSLSPKTKFRSLVRFLIQNLGWLKGETANLETNIYNTIKAMKCKEDLLNLQEKFIMVRDHRSRTEEEKQVIRKKLRQLKCINKRPEELQDEIIDSLYFLYYKKGRVILREGQWPKEWGGMYMVLKGEIEMYYLKTDRFTHELSACRAAIKKAGSVFGEITLLKPPRKNTCVVLSETCELLVMHVENFNKILGNLLSSQYEIIDSCFQRFQQFKDWSEEIKTKSTEVVCIRNYQKNELILGNNQLQVNGALFLMKGECEIISALNVKKEVVNLNISYSLHPDQNTYLAPSMKEETVFLSLCTLTPGMVFNIGEDLKNKVVMSKTSETTFLSCPMYFLEANDRSLMWKRTRLFLNSTFPSVEDQFKWFCSSRKLLSSERQLQMQYKCKNVRTDLLDTSISCRVNELDPIEYYIKAESNDCRQMFRIEEKLRKLSRKERQYQN